MLVAFPAMSYREDRTMKKVWWKMMANPTSTSCGMTQSMRASRLHQSCNQGKKTSTSEFFLFCTDARCSVILSPKTSGF